MLSRSPRRSTDHPIPDPEPRFQVLFLNEVEEILEMVDEWLYTFDEDDDGFLSGSEVEGLLKQLRQGSSVTGDAAAALTPQLLMSQVRSAA